jgi:hypothetical protein
MKNFHKVPRAALPDQMISAAKALMSGKVSGFTPEQGAERAAELFAGAELLAAKDLAAVERRAAAIEATAQAESAQQNGIKIFTEIKHLLNSVSASPADFDALGITPPAARRSMVTLYQPTDLAAKGENGYVVLSWNSPNASGEVQFLIYERSESNGQWRMIGISTTLQYKHQNVPGGEFHQYMIKAQASGFRYSGWSEHSRRVWASR